MSKYDDASWHHGGDFPKELAYDQACLHIAMFVGWAVDHGLQSQMLEEQFAPLLARFREREQDPVQLLHACCDDKLTSDELSDEGNAFAEDYYESDLYVDDYDEVLGADLPSLFHVENDWAHYERMSAKIDERYADWKVRKRHHLPRS